MNKNEAINEVLESIIKQLDTHYKDAQEWQKDPKNKDFFEFYKGEMFAYETAIELLQDRLIDYDNL